MELDQIQVQCPLRRWTQWLADVGIEIILTKKSLYVLFNKFAYISRNLSAMRFFTTLKNNQAVFALAC